MKQNGRLTIEDIKTITGINPLDAQQRDGSLTERQRQVYDLFVDGLSTPEIAERLGISVKTLDIHRGDVFTKIAGSSGFGTVPVVMNYVACRLAERIGL